MLRRFLPATIRLPEVSATPIIPDPLALRDDLAHAAAVLATAPDGGTRHYLAGFLTGIARQAQDPALEAAAGAAGQAPLDRPLEALRGMINRRLDRCGDGFELRGPVSGAKA